MALSSIECVFCTVLQMYKGFFPHVASATEGQREGFSKSLPLSPFKTSKATFLKHHVEYCRIFDRAEEENIARIANAVQCHP